MNDYELILAIDPNIGDEKVGGIISKVEDKLKALGGELEKIDKWGIKRLSSAPRKARQLHQAFYVVFYFKAAPSVPKDMTNLLKVTEHIVRYFIGRRKETLPAPIEEKAPEIEEKIIGQP